MISDRVTQVLFALEVAHYLTIGGTAKISQDAYVDIFGEEPHAPVAENGMGTARMHAGTVVPARATSRSLVKTAGIVVVVPDINAGRGEGHIEFTDRIDTDGNPTAERPPRRSAVKRLQGNLGHHQRIAETIGAICERYVTVFTEEISCIGGK